MLHIYNTLSRKKERFVSLSPGRIGLYVCGMTVYDYCHLGHARLFSVFDTIVRYLRFSGYQVDYVRNITDVDDKIIQRAQANEESYLDLTQRMIQAMHEDDAALNILRPDKEPKASESIPLMIQKIEQLLAKDLAYIASSGDILYRVDRFQNYGQLAHQAVEELKIGARVAPVREKANPLDFVLWKLTSDQPSWPSPWGVGRPGWHIECSAMAMDYLGETFDLHGGGLDLVFPHHQNEIAQSEGITGKPFVRYWMHIGFVQVNEVKMSKSLGNFFTVKEMLKLYSGEVIRYFLLASHYRSPLHYTQENLNSAQAGLIRLYTALRDLPKIAPIANSIYELKFKEAMDDDFNTPLALSVLFDLARTINRLKPNEPEQAASLAALLRKLAQILGFLHQSVAEFFKTHHSEAELEEIQALVDRRTEARRLKNWAEADRLRDLLLDKQIVLEDTATGTIWHRILK